MSGGLTAPASGHASGVRRLAALAVITVACYVTAGHASHSAAMSMELGICLVAVVLAVVAAAAQRDPFPTRIRLLATRALAPSPPAAPLEAARASPVWLSRFLE